MGKEKNPRGQGYIGGYIDCRRAQIRVDFGDMGSRCISLYRIGGLGSVSYRDPGTGQHIILQAKLLGLQKNWGFKRVYHSFDVYTESEYVKAQIHFGS